MTKWQEVVEENHALSKKVLHLSKIAEKASESVEPYKNNVILMEQQLNQIKQSINTSNQTTQNPSPSIQSSVENEFNEKKRTIDF